MSNEQFKLKSTIKGLLVTVLVVASCFCLKTNAATATELTQYGVTWVFDKEYEVGQFASGDYYVVGPITITSITPSASNGRNGTQLNPYVGGSTGNPSTPKQPFDSRAYAYDPTTLFQSGVVMPGTSVVSTISKTGSEKTNWANKGISSNAFLWSAAVLTVLDSKPSASAFRPAYNGTNKKLFYLDQVNWGLLPNLSLDGITLPAHPGFGTVEYFLRGFERPWISTHGRDWTSRNIAAENNQFDYHEEIGFFYSEATLLLMADLTNLDIPDKRKLTIGFIQNCIDLSAAVSVPGVETSAVWAWPIVLCGLLLDEPAISNFWINNPNTRTQRDHEKFYYIGDRTTSTKSTIVPDGETWVGWRHPISGKFPAFSKQKGEEYEHLHPKEWVCYAPHCKSEVYRAQHDVHPIIGLTLSSIIVDGATPMDVNAMIAHNPIRDYADRWMNDGFMTEVYKPTGRTFVEEMKASQSFTIYNYNYGTGGSRFVTDMWNKYRNSNVAPPHVAPAPPILNVN